MHLPGTHPQASFRDFLHSHLSLPRSQFSLTLQPAWRLRSTNDKVRCTNGDPWELMLDQVNSQIIDWAQWGLNELIKMINRVPFVHIDYICWNTPAEPNRCPRSQENEEHFRECRDPEAKNGLDMTCYFHRVRFFACTPPRFCPSRTV